MPLWLSMASTRVVLPWSTWAMMAMLRMLVLLLFMGKGENPSEVLPFEFNTEGRDARRSLQVAFATFAAAS